jgi:Fur family transcriptional regulator, zinc uptake regulator
MMSGKAERTIAARLERAARACAAEGAQLTELRRRVLRLVFEAEGPLTAYQLLDRLKQTRKGAVPPTIYRALDFLVAHQLVHKLERLNAFVPCAETGHRHAAQFPEMDDRAAAKALDHAAERKGFHPRSAIVEIEGTCAACSAA